MSDVQLYIYKGEAFFATAYEAFFAYEEFAHEPLSGRPVEFNYFVEGRGREWKLAMAYYFKNVLPRKNEEHERKEKLRREVARLDSKLDGNAWKCVSMAYGKETSFLSPSRVEKYCSTYMPHYAPGGAPCD